MSEFHEEELYGAIARGWCDERNRDKEMDVDLGDAIAIEILALVRPLQRQIQHESSGTGVEMVPVDGDELVGDGSGEALPELLIPDYPPACYGNPPEDEGWDHSQCEECMVLDLCMEYVNLSEGLEEPPEPETPTWPESPAKPETT